MAGLQMPPTWQELIGEEPERDYYARLADFVDSQYAQHTIYPPREKIFRAFDMCDPGDVRVVIIGQDPYHGPGQADGLCFSVGDGVRFPPSLRNIFREVHDDLGAPIPGDGNLGRWADQGVLLLNSVLTVRAGAAASHAERGWERLTDAIVGELAAQHDNIVYMLWGRYAQQKGVLVDGSRNCVLNAVHPSPLSAHRGFFGCRHFSQANAYLEESGRGAIVW